MATVGDIAREVAASIATDEAYLLALTWVQNRYNEMVSRVRFRHLRKVGELNLPAAYNTGTIIATRDSTEVRGVGTSWTSFLPITASLDGRYYFRASTTWYEIAERTDDTTIVLSTPFAETTTSTGYDTGAVNVTNGSATITGVPDGGGISPEWTSYLPATADLDSKYWFKSATNWYEIIAVVSDTEITLDTPYSEVTAAGASYEIEDRSAGYYTVQRNHSLPSDVRQIGDFAHDRLRRAFSPISLTEMDMAYRSRVLIGPGPAQVAQVGTDSSGNVMVEVYPPATTSEMLRYVYWELPSTFTPTTTIPPQIDSYTLKEGVLIDAYRYMMSLAGKSGDATMFASWRNEMRTQITSWEYRIQDAIRTDRGAFDSTVASLDWKHQNKGAAFRDNPVDGYDIVLNRWSYQYV